MPGLDSLPYLREICHRFKITCETFLRGFILEISLKKLHAITTAGRVNESLNEYSCIVHEPVVFVSGSSG